MGILAGSRYSYPGFLRKKWWVVFPDRVADPNPGLVVGSGYFGHIRIFQLDPGILIRGSLEKKRWAVFQDRVADTNPGLVVGSGYFDRIQVFLSGFLQKKAMCGISR